MRNRRLFLFGLCALPLATSVARAQTSLPPITIHKDPNCGCCQAWADRLGEAGFQFEIVEDKAMNRRKARLGVPQRLASCHTAEVAGYVIEGHVPPAEIKRLIAERPAARGLSVPGMPVNSPGMEVPNASDEAYDVILFGDVEDKVFARYSGARKV